MLRAVIIVAVALAAASSVSAQTTRDHQRRLVPFDRKPVERVETKDASQAQAPERPPTKAQPVSASDAKPM